MGSAALGGALYFLAYVGYGVWPLATVFLVPLWRGLVAVEARGPAAAAGVGAVFGAAAYAGGFPWLWRLVDVFLEGHALAGAALWLAYGAWFALGFAAHAVLFRALHRRGWPVAAAGVPGLVVLEWLFPQVFPVHAGNALVAFAPLVQAADLGGPLLLSAGVAGANGVAYATWAWLRRERPRPLVTWCAAAGVLLGVLAYGQLRGTAVARAADEAPALRVGLVQANLGLLEKRTQGARSHHVHLETTRALLAEGELDLVVWPETAYIRGLRRPLPVSGDLIRGDVRVPLLFGGSSVRQQGGRRVRHNSALLVGADGMIRSAYDKNLLIPLAEYAPLARLLPGLASLFPHVQEFGAARHAPPLTLGRWRISTPICYEAISAPFVRRMVAEGDPHLLVSLANDAWFGDSQEPWMHLDLARLRAVEHRRYLVRATNSGISAIVDPLGRVVARTDLLAAQTLRGTVHLLEGRTVYARLGDWPGWLALAACGLLLARPRHGATAPPGERLAG
jgi:apolipoprotein N-acyltransferase